MSGDTTEAMQAALVALFRDAIDWGRSYGQRVNLTDATLLEVAEGFADKVHPTPAAPAVTDSTHTGAVPSRMGAGDPRNTLRHPLIHDGYVAGWNACIDAFLADQISPDRNDCEPVAWWRLSYVDKEGFSDADVQIGSTHPDTLGMTPNGFEWKPLYGKPLREGKSLNASDTELLDWLEENCFLGTMDKFDRRRRPNSTMWTFFAPNTVQGSARRILAAALATQARSAEK